ncbi:hypothetical protein COLO4_03975 [Corchorus olitorius]|uniref:Uncharacterized protein n=1 Tax=Corchorus olitorius TaxID=93759 RepID=A0A1R3KVW9_9ROSI|nr:hypothetical protein COLO4_03975 [Corchorus olitorius]
MKNEAQNKSKTQSICTYMKRNPKHILKKLIHS